MKLEADSRRRSPGICRWNRFLQLLVHVLLAPLVFLDNSAVGQYELQHAKGSDIPITDSRERTSSSGQEPGTAPSQKMSEHKKSSGSRGSLIIAPLPISSPALGTGVIPVLGYIFPFRRKDKVSPPSVVGAAGLVTDNGSRAFALFADLFLCEDTYRITSIYARGNINYDLYGIGVIAANEGRKFPLEQSGQIYRAEFLRRLGWDFFLGLRFWSGGSVVTPRGTSGPNPQGSYQKRPTVITSKPANGSGLGLGCFTPPPPEEASLFSCANSVDRI